MNHDRQQTLEQITALFDSQRLAVLSTQTNNQPYASLVAFAASPDLEYVYLSTPDTTRKYEHLITNPKVSVLVNDSRNQAEDIYDAIAVTGTGVAEVVGKKAEKDALDMYLKKHSYLKDFISDPTTAFVRITVQRYFLVSRFQHVVEVDIPA